MRKRGGSTLTYQYDNLNRMIRKTVPERAGLAAAHTRDLFYGYDLRNLQTFARFDSASGEGVTNSYDGFGRLASHSINLGGVARTLAYQYDAAGNRTRITHPDGTFFSTDYDSAGRPWRMREPDNDAIATMAYDAQGRPSALGFLGGTGAAYTYDNLSRLLSLTHNLDGTAQDAAWTYGRNPAGQLVSVARDNDLYAWTGHYAVNRNYTADGLNRYSAAGSASFTYDANGNLISDGARTFAYDVENRLVGSGTLTLSYDPLGRLHQSSGGASGTTRFLYDGDALVVEYDGANVFQRRYVHGAGADVPLVWYEGANIRRYLHADHQGSIVAIGQAYAAPYAINRYDEYGVPASTNLGRFQYTGQIWLPDLGMYHYKARVYSPTLGRFMQTDPVGYQDQYNLYAYVRNDPVNHSDPSGECCYEDTDSRRDQVTRMGDAARQFAREHPQEARAVAIAGATLMTGATIGILAPLAGGATLAGGASAEAAPAAPAIVTMTVPARAAASLRAPTLTARQVGATRGSTVAARVAPRTPANVTGVRQAPTSTVAGTVERTPQLVREQALARGIMDGGAANARATYEVIKDAFVEFLRAFGGP